MHQSSRWSVAARALLVAAACALLAASAGPAAAFGQEPPRAAAAAPQARGPMAPPVVSPDVASDGHITFRIYAPQAQVVRLSAGDIPGLMGQNTQLKKGDNNVWEITIGPIAPGAYRYTFNVDGVATVDPRNNTTSESNNNVSSLVVVPGSDLFDTKDVPHGAVAAVTYKSTALGRFRRMHIYTPPGYESGKLAYPVFYLLHGAGDCDEAWTSVGRAGFILDNLIAAKKARPMVVVMPAGHATTTGGNVVGRSATDAFVNDFVQDVMPYVETHYRVLKGRANTAIAGLSMGGIQTLQVAIPRLERFAYIGVYSSGLIGAFPELAGRGGRAAPPTAPATPPAAPAAAAPAAPAPPAAPSAAAPAGRGGAPAEPTQTAAEWAKQHASKLDDPKLKTGLKLLWFGTGKDDFLMSTTQATVDLLKQHGFKPVFVQSDGGHTWINWRNYLAEFAPKLFQTGK